MTRPRLPGGALQFLALAAGVFALQPIPLQAQDPGTERIGVVLECSGRACDAEFFQDELTWVDWVATADEADITIVLTPPPGTGAGEFVLDFEASDAAGFGSDRLSYAAAEGESDQQVLDGLATLMSIGLARYSTIAGARDFIQLRPVVEEGIDPNERVVSAEEVEDPWNLWTFRVGGNGNFDGEETSETRRFSGNFSANRTTPTWDISFNGRGNVNIREITRSDGSVFKSDQRDWNFSSGVTYALADHWSAHLGASTGAYPTANQDFRFGLTPGVEYSYFPYEEATRRSITARWTLGPTYRDYEEETVFGKLEETRWEQEFRLRAALRQPWGDASATVTTSHILDDIDLHNVSLRGDLSFRIIRGLSLNTGGDVSWVTDQFYLSADGATDEEILLRLRNRASSFNYGMNIGFSYQFGSIYNNTVNNRFPGAPGGGGGGGGRGGRGGGGNQ